MEFFFNNEDHIGGVMVKLAFMPLVRWIVGLSPGRVKAKTITLVSAASSPSRQH